MQHKVKQHEPKNFFNKPLVHHDHPFLLLVLGVPVALLDPYSLFLLLGLFYLVVLDHLGQITTELIRYHDGAQSAAIYVRDLSKVVGS